jgi:hypothetical protein
MIQNGNKTEKQEVKIVKKWLKQYTTVTLLHSTDTKTMIVYEFGSLDFLCILLVMVWFSLHSSFKLPPFLVDNPNNFILLKCLTVERNKEATRVVATQARI